MAGNYNPYNGNLYMQEMQSMKDRIDRQMQQYQQSQNQFMQQQQQQPQIQQTFQLAPNQNNNSGFDARPAQNLEEVKNFLVLKPTLFVNDDYSILWTKDTNGNIKTFKMEEIVQVDENIQEINNLKQELADIKALLLHQAQTQRKLPENPQPIEEIKQEKKVVKK